MSSNFATEDIENEDDDIDTTHHDQELSQKSRRSTSDKQENDDNEDEEDMDEDQDEDEDEDEEEDDDDDDDEEEEEEEEEDNMDEIRRILDENNQSLICQLQKTKKGTKRQGKINKYLKKHVIGLRDKYFELNDEIDKIKKKDNKNNKEIAKINTNQQKYGKDIKTMKKSQKELKSKYKVLNKKLFSCSNDDKISTDVQALKYWMTRYGKFNESLQKVLISKYNISTFDALKNVSIHYLSRIDEIAIDEIPGIYDKIKGITSGIIIECSQQCINLKNGDKSSVNKVNECIKPRYEYMDITGNAIPKSKATKLIQQELQTLLNDNKMDEIRVDFEGIRDKKRYHDVIVDFIEMNDIGNIDPDKIRMRKKIDLGPSSGTRKKRKEQEEHYDFNKLSDLVVIAKCKKPRNKELKDKNGVFAVKDIPEMTVLGEYIGITFLEKEFEDIFQGTLEKSEHEKYTIKTKKKMAVSLTFLKEIYGDNNNNDNDNDNNDNNDDNDNNHNKKRSHNEMMNEEDMNGNKPSHKKRKLNDNSSSDTVKMERCEKYEKTMIFIVDPISLKKKKKIESPLWEINDCREYIFMDVPRKEDEMKQNVKCITCYVQNWPHIFIVTTKNIKAGHELLSFCGPGYEDNIYAQRRDNEIRTKMQ